MSWTQGAYGLSERRAVRVLGASRSDDSVYGTIDGVPMPYGRVDTTADEGRQDR